VKHTEECLHPASGLSDAEYEYVCQLQQKQTWYFPSFRAAILMTENSIRRAVGIGFFPGWLSYDTLA
jgi:hypothetical protein